MRMMPPAALALLLAILAPAGVARAAGGGMEPAKGRFLVAERDLRDPNFAETVVLLVSYDADGAMGLIVNWPTGAPVAELIPEIEGADRRSDKVFVGGPVARQLMLMLVRSAADLVGAKRIFEDVHISTDRELLEEVMGGRLEVEDFRVYSGYAGWAPGQLDAELAAGGWLVQPAEADLVFDGEPDGVWRRLIERGAVRWAGRRAAVYGFPAGGPFAHSQSR